MTTEFRTRNNRLVYSGGGISPDTTVSAKLKSDFVKDLLAKGMIFEFVNGFYEKNKSLKFENLNENLILDEFNSFLKKKKYEFKHPKIVQLNELILTFGQDKNYVHLQGKIEELKKEIEKTSKNILDLHKTETANEILLELAGRYHDSGFRIKYRLTDDVQFKTALDIINNKSLYRKLLALN
ncbi:MAG: hypothetical protein IPG53_02635 [Ignavibacteriales bacterium]|nr:hypothetical protein [Ignavibacteriales bacterium]